MIVMFIGNIQTNALQFLQIQCNILIVLQIILIWWITETFLMFGIVMKWTLIGYKMNKGFLHNKIMMLLYLHNFISRISYKTIFTIHYKLRTLTKIIIVLEGIRINKLEIAHVAQQIRCVHTSMKIWNSLI